jgi:protein TonB
VAAHGAAIALLVWALGHTGAVRVLEPDSLVYVEPAPPPPPPLGAPSGEATAPPLVTEPPKPVVRELPKQQPKPQRLVEPTPKPKRTPRPPPPAETARVPAGESSGSTEGVTGGTPGGTPGGELGGTVGGHGDTPIPAARVAHPPVLVERTLPAYPVVARVRGVEGQVLLEAVIGRDGKVEDAIKVLRSLPLLDQSAVDALRRWRFEPGRDADGRAVRVVLEVPIRFQLR